MGLFDWFTIRNSKTPYINQEVFTEQIVDDLGKEENPALYSPVSEIREQNKIIAIRKELDDFLSNDFGSQGYENALINPDSSNADSHKEILKYQLEIIIDRVLTKLQNEISNFEFHIKTRTKNGMLDTVEEINSEMEKYAQEIKKIEVILTEARQNTGKGHIIVLSFEQGFKKGLAAITASKLFGKNTNNA